MPTPATGVQLSEPELELVRAALAETDAPTDPGGWQLEEGGGSHRVVLVPERFAVRLTRHREAAESLTRRTALVDALPELPVAVPRSVGPVVGAGDRRAVATQWVPGEPSPRRVDPDALGELLAALAAVDPTPLTDLIAAPLAYGGGADWWDLQQQEVLPRLPSAVRPAARRMLTELAELDPVPDRLVHGDLAGANLRWRSGRVVGVLDWDLATAYDPALDVACLADWHGWSLVAPVAEPAVVGRARVQQACFVLHTVAHLIITRGSDDPAVSDALEQAAVRLRG